MDTDSSPDARMIHLVVRFNLHPEADLHPSWLPDDWPARHRTVRERGTAAQCALADLLQARPETATAPLYRFDTRLKRLALVDPPSLRRLAFYTGLSVHASLLRQRGDAANALRRQARRFARDAVDFVLDRLPSPDALRMDTQALQQRPSAAGRLVMARGYRLLLGSLAHEGSTAIQRVRHKLPRTVSALSVPHLQPRQQRQLEELMLDGIVPDRLPTWDWLF
jgi:type III secretion protein K